MGTTKRNIPKCIFFNDEWRKTEQTFFLEESGSGEKLNLNFEGKW